MQLHTIQCPLKIDTLTKKYLTKQEETPNNKTNRGPKKAMEAGQSDRKLRAKRISANRELAIGKKDNMADHFLNHGCLHG
jgi:hypothetical protein